MSRVVIKAENISKLYRLGEVGSATFAQDLNRWWAKLRGKEDPYVKIASTNDRTTKGDSDYVWALKDISFEINQGEVWGIVGKNGAGKSTLLKILSRTTLPTSGSLKIKGRIASLLEVGTGFHPDLSGRDNIFLNGAILGMTKAEIRKRFDEIVAFSGVERYIDTPVKRYSSGMYVRLAFAVAAHLDPEIMIVDEVLAVGDAEFQKKCLGKMKDVSGQGKTVLFVSHNMAAIRALCSKGLLLKNGTLTDAGEIEKIIASYLGFEGRLQEKIEKEIPENLSLYYSGEAKFKSAFIINEDRNETADLKFREKFTVVLELEVFKKIENVNISVGVYNRFGEKFFNAISLDSRYSRSTFLPGKYKILLQSSVHLMPGIYSLGFGLSHFFTGTCIDYIENFYNFTVAKETKDGKFEYPWETVHGYFEPETNWTIDKI